MRCHLPQWSRHQLRQQQAPYVRHHVKVKAAALAQWLQRHCVWKMTSSGTIFRDLRRYHTVLVPPDPGMSI
jgi:hypothetical protein